LAGDEVRLRPWSGEAGDGGELAAVEGVGCVEKREGES